MHNYWKTTQTVYQRKTLKDGTVILVPVGETDVDAAIQSHREEVDLYALMKKASITGDYDSLKSGKGVYADITGYPRCFNDAQKLINSIPKKISEIPDIYKGAFESYEDFVNAVANGSFAVRANEYITNLQNQKVEVTENADKQ